ncbi:tocopherol cyclase, chloroplastic-like [Rutidosis leptorrhynchoides]|uniref:tocopherol cyclase, chloroplastic-like n=1 Tax=Rutidosis leptorrhynchoides TaxID=125765 RepID=UPI003A98D19E
MSKSEIYDSVEFKPKQHDEAKEIVNPVYLPTHSNRPLRTPHSGYHFDGTRRNFFEGWYFKVSIPEQRQSFCFMYSVENPAFNKPLNTLEQLSYGPRSTGVGAQILGADDKYICQYNKESPNFWGSRHELMLGNTFSVEKGQRPPNGEVPPKVFNQSVVEGFQVTPLWHQGCIRDDGRTNYANVVKTARWEYSTRPVYGWGNVGSKQKSTAGWLAAFPVFELHWQICMAAGLSTGKFDSCDLYAFVSHPYKSIENHTFYVLIIQIGVHFGGIFHEFAPWNGVIEREIIAQWGYWHVTADNETHKVELEASTKDPGTTLRAPTTEAGFAPACKDTCFGDLTLKLWEKGSDGSKGKLILDVTSNMAAVEVGGGPWFNTWKGKTYTPEILGRVLSLPVDVEGILGLFPLLKPPGL